MKSALSFNKQPVFIGDKVYQIGVNRSRHKLFEFKITEIDGDKLTVEFADENGTGIATTAANQTHTNKLELIKSWMDKKMEYYYKFLPAEIADLLSIYEENGGTIESGIKERFGKLDPNESL